jgi:hypothetical protein
MKPSSAKALTSAMVGTVKPVVASFFAVWALASSYLPQPAASAARKALNKAPMQTARLELLIMVIIFSSKFTCVLSPFTTCLGQAAQRLS